MPELHLALIENAEMSELSENGVRRRTVKIYVPENPVVIDYDRKQSPWFWLECVDQVRKKVYTSIASHENPLIPPSAGVISFFKDSKDKVRYVAMAQKDMEAPRDPGYRVPRNGFPENETDWYTMEHLYKEAFGEGLFLTRNYDLILPEDGKAEDIILDRAKFIESKTPIRIKGTKRVSISFEDGPDKLLVYRGQENKPRYSGSGMISWTPETGFNFIKPMIVHYPMEETLVVDPETKPNGELIGRDQCIIHLDDIRGKKFGDPIHERVQRVKEGNEFLAEVKIIEREDRFLTDKVPRSVFCNFNYNGISLYPIDWMDESYEFLSRPDVQKAFNRAFAFSDFEKKIKVKK